MAIISAILYFLSQYGTWSLLLVPLVGIIIAIPVAILSRRGRIGIWIAAIFAIYAFANIYIGQIPNALFLKTFGETGSGVVTHSEPTNSRLNEQTVWAYDIVLKTADGRDVVTRIDTMSATIYPITNSIYIPPVGDRFVTRYIPGFPRNFVIMRDESAYGQRMVIAEHIERVSKAERQWQTSPENPAFIAEYRLALTQFIDRHGETAAPSLVASYRARLNTLPVQTTPPTQ